MDFWYSHFIAGLWWNVHVAADSTWHFHCCYWRSWPGVDILQIILAINRAVPNSNL